MRIGLFTDSYVPSVNGVITSVETLKKALEQKGHTIYIVTVGHDSKTYDYDEKEKILRIPGIPLGIYDYRMSSIYPLKVINWIKSWDLQLIHSHTELSMGIFARLFAKQYNIPLVHTYHTMYKDYTWYVSRNIKFFDMGCKKAVEYLSKFYCDNTADAFIVPTVKTYHLFRDEYHYDKDIYIVPTGVDGYTFTGWYIGKSGEGFGYEYKEEITKTDFKENYLYVYGAFLSNSVENAYSGYSINFNANGGTIDGKTVKEYGYVAPNSGYPIYFNKLVPERSGYKFLGWNTKADGTGKNLTGLYWAEWNKDRWNEGDWYELDGKKLTLYATWEKTADTPKPPVTNKVEELSTKVEGTEVEVKVELEKALEEGSKLQIVKVAEEKVTEVKKLEENLKAVFDINVVSNAGDIIKIEDNKMQIRMLLEENLRGYDKYQVVYIKDGKIVEEKPTKIDGNYIIFETDHLSEYGIIATNNEETVDKTQGTTNWR